MPRRTLVPVLLLILFPLLRLGAQVRHLPVGKEPAAVFADSARNRIHVITAGIDQNFNGRLELDSGDVAPSWYLIDPITEKMLDSMSFDGFFNSFPIRVGVDLAHQRVYAPMNGRVRAYDALTLELVKDTVTLGAYSGVSVEPISGALILHMRPGPTTPGYIVGMHPATGAVLAVAPVGINPQMSVTLEEPQLGTPALYTMNEGVFGAKNASISYSASNPDVFETINGKKLGGGASQIVVREDTAYVVLNGTHQIRMIDTRTNSELERSPIATLTQGFDGPRGLAFQGDSVIVVGTYANDLRRFRLGSGALIDSIKMPGKVEAVAILDSLAFAAIKYTAGTYDADSLIVVVNLKTGRSIDTLVVSADPAALFIDRRGDLHVIGYGTADSARWWQVIDTRNFGVKTRRTFSGALGFPLRAAYDPAGDSLYIVVADSLRAWSAVNPLGAGRTVYSDHVASGELTGVALADGHLLVNELPKNFGSTPGFVHVLEIASGKRIAAFMTGPFLSMATRVNGSRKTAMSFYAINEGIFGSPSSTLSAFAFQPNIFADDTLGDGANHLLLVSTTLAVTMNGSHEFVIADLDRWKIEEKYPTGTSGFDGPREAAFLDDDHAVITTYAGDVRIIGSKGVTRTIPVGGKAEGLAMLGNKLFVANILTPSYAPDSNVAVIDQIALRIERQADVASAELLEQNFPNPAATTTKIRFGVARPGYVTLELYSAMGQRVMSLVDREMEPGTYTVDVATSALPSGDYIYTLRSGDVRFSRTMKVVR